MAKRVVDVLVPVALDRAYSYRVPDELEIAPGDIVSVPLGAREATAVVWAENPKPNPRLDNRLKDIEEKLEIPPLKPELRSFVDWVANYTVASRGMVLRMCLRMGEHLGAERERVGVRLAGPAPQRMTAARERALALLADGMVRGKSDAAREAGVSAGVIDGLIDEGTLETLVLPPEPVAEKPDPDFTATDFTSDQNAAAVELRATVATGGYSVTLLDGVTGSGKTEVYFEAVADTIRARPAEPDPDAGDRAHRSIPRPLRRALRRARRRSGIRNCRRANARAPGARSPMATCRVVVGARSALFLPYADLGLIVVDEEHDQAYKQEDGVHYHARDMAVVRGHIAAIPVMLSSATPSLETEVNARRGRYRRLALPERFGGARMPSVEAIDLRRERPPPGRFIAPSLAGAVQTAFERGEQALFFLNRRGYAPLTLCRACGFRFSCPNCDAWLVDHRFRKQLVCHHCGFAMPHPAACPKCQAVNSLRRHRAGRRTPGGGSARAVSAGAAAGAVERSRRHDGSAARGAGRRCRRPLRHRHRHAARRQGPSLPEAQPRRHRRRRSRPRATATRARPSAPSSFCIRWSGRAGRDAGVGHGYLQTHQPEHPVMRALIAGDREAFYSAEIAMREAAHYPPFGRLASIVVSGPDKHDTQCFRAALARAAPLHDEVRVLGPADAPLSLVRGRHRLRLLIKAPRAFDLSAYLRDWLAAAPKPKGSN